MLDSLLRRRVLRWALQAAPLVVFGLLLWFADRQRLLEALRGPKASWLLLAGLSALASAAAQASSWRILLLAQGWRALRSRCLGAHLVGIFFGRLTPNHLGEWAKVAYVLEGPMGRGLATVAGEKLLKLAATMGFGLGAAVWLWKEGLLASLGEATEWPGATGMGLLALALGAAGITALALRRGWIRLPRQDRLSSIWRDFLEGLVCLKGPGALRASLWAAVALVAFGLQALFVAWALELELSAPQVIASHLAALALFHILPFSAGGFGTGEVAVLALFARFGIEASSGLAYVLIQIALANIFLPALGALVWLARPLTSREVLGHGPTA